MRNEGTTKNEIGSGSNDGGVNEKGKGKGNKKEGEDESFFFQFIILNFQCNS